MTEGKKVTERENQVFIFLIGRDWTSPTEIGKCVWGVGRHSASASPVCKSLVSKGLLIRSDIGHYKLSISPVCCACGNSPAIHEKVKGLSDGFVIRCSGLGCKSTTQRVGLKNCIDAWNSMQTSAT